MPESRKTVPTRDYDAVAAVTQAYVDDMRSGDAEGTVRAYHEDAPMFGLLKGELSAGPARGLRGFVAGYGASADLEARVDVLAIIPTTAVARIDMENALGNDYTNLLLLVKREERWSIVAKTFHQYVA